MHIADTFGLHLALFLRAPRKSSTSDRASTFSAPASLEPSLSPQATESTSYDLGLRVDAYVVALFTFGQEVGPLSNRRPAMSAER